MIKNKKGISLISVGLAFLLIGCAGSSEANSSVEESPASYESQEASTKDITSEEATKEVTANESTDEGSKTLYEDFIADKSEVYMNSKADTGSTLKLSGLNDGEKYTLSAIEEELVRVLSEESEDASEIEVSQVRNAYIDCGNDGEQELLLAVEISSYFDTYEEWLIIKAKDNELHLCFSGDSWSRKAQYINEYGYIRTEGSGGASYSNYEYSFVDKDGEWHFLFGSETEEFTGQEEVYLNEKSYKLSDYGLSDDQVAMAQFYFEPLTDEENGNVEYTFFKYGEIDVDDEVPYFYCKVVKEDPVYDSDSGYYKLFEDAGITVISIEEIEKEIDTAMEKIGYDKALEKGEIPIVTEYDF